MQRVAVYIDGLNLYYGMKTMGWRRYYWLDLQRLSENMTRPYQRLRFVRYFTAKFLPDDNDPGQTERQDAYLQALSSLPKVRIQYGFHISKTIACPHCGAGIRRYEEKMTDVNIAVALLEDAHDDLFDVAILISADSDLTTPVEVVRQKYANKQVVAAFPPARISRDLREVATASFTISRRLIAQSPAPRPRCQAGWLPRRQAGAVGVRRGAGRTRQKIEARVACALASVTPLIEAPSFLAR